MKERVYLTKKDFIEAMKDMPDDAPIYFWNLFHNCWEYANPIYVEKISNYDTINGEKITEPFIGIE